MSFESLANELLFDVFEYFSTVDLFHSFNGLNSRFDNLIIDRYRKQKSLDFRLIFKEDLNIIRRRYLPILLDDITSISLSDGDTNPHQIDLFLSRIFPLHRFQNLQSISFFNIYSIQKTLRVLSDLKEIPQLTKLSLKGCHFQYEPKYLVEMINSIWSLPKLISCHLDISFDNICYLITPTIISCSIRQLSIKGVRCGLENLLYLHEYTPYLENLSVEDIWEPSDSYPQLSLMSSLMTFQFQCNNSLRLIEFLLRKMPNLTSLTVQTRDINMGGKTWENLLSKYLPKLKKFNLNMEYKLWEINNIEEEIDRIVDSYKTSFWIDQHQWFIQCYCHVDDNDNSLHLHTLPYQLEHFKINVNDDDHFIFRSTYPYLSYNTVRSLDYCYTISEHTFFSQMKFSNVQSLALTLPYNDHLQLIVPQLDNLISLEIRMVSWCQNDNNLAQLQALLDQTPRLYYLKFHSWSTGSSKSEHKNKKNGNTTISKMPPFSSSSSSVRYLDLRGQSHSGECHSYNDQQCSLLIRSPLGSLCEHLLIEVEKRSNIIDLINKMSNLRTLNVRCRDRKKNDDELIKWLRSHLPSTCSFAKDANFSQDIRIWIR